MDVREIAYTALFDCALRQRGTADVIATVGNRMRR